MRVWLTLPSQITVRSTSSATGESCKLTSAANEIACDKRCCKSAASTIQAKGSACASKEIWPDESPQTCICCTGVASCGHTRKSINNWRDAALSAKLRISFVLSGAGRAPCSVTRMRSRASSKAKTCPTMPAPRIQISVLTNQIVEGGTMMGFRLSL